MTSSMTAMSSMVVDISGDNDSAGALAAAANIPSAAADAPFERSCDNPECSAPKLISLVPKRETPEFITEPMIMAQPTLINGFTTVFQIDGIGARMNEIMYGDQNANSATRPKSVFRIVPNTHAHIVNYVVVDGAGETMRKIKGNDVDTMRKLLDSQRLSAEQMLKKLVGKAFKVPPHQEKQMQINNKVQMASPTQEPAPAKNLPPVPPGITITPVLLPDGTPKQVPSSISTKPQASRPIKVTAKITPLKTTAAMKRKSASAATSTSTVATATTATTAPTTTASPTATSSTPILRRVLAPKSAAEKTQTTPSPQLPSPPVTRYGRPNILKRKLEETPTETDTIKRLRPRSPKPKCQTPLATGLKKIKPTSPPPARKLPTLPTKLTNKLPIASVPVKIILPHKKPSDVPAERIDHSYKSNRVPITKPAAETSSPSSAPSPKRTKEAPKDSSSLVCNESLPTKTKPLMGPASKINALRAIAAAKVAVAHVTKTEQLTTTKPNPPKKASESSITTSTPLTRPCSVTIEKADIPINIIIKPKEPMTVERITSSPDLISDSETNNSPVKEIPETDRPTDKTDSRSVLKSNAPKINTTGGLTVKPVMQLNRKVTGTSSDPKLNAISALRARAAANQKLKMASLVTPTDEVDPLALNDTEISEETNNAAKTGGATLRTVSKADELSLLKPLPDRQLKPRTTLPTLPTLPKLDTTTATKTNLVAAKATETVSSKVTRSSTPRVLLTKGNETPPISSSLSPRSVKVKLPTLKSGVMTIPVRSPHPNLKIASVISGGSAVAAATSAASIAKQSTGKVVSDESSGSDIEKLQLELAALRRTVDRLTKKKP